MNTSRLQHIVPAGTILVLALVVAYLSFTQQPAESFLFPRIISVAFVSLAVWNFIRAATGLARVGDGITSEEFWNFLPGLTLMLIYIFWAAKGSRDIGKYCTAEMGGTFYCLAISKGLGFYTASAIVFFLLYSFYDATEDKEEPKFSSTLLTALIGCIAYISICAVVWQIAPFTQPIFDLILNTTYQIGAQFWNLLRDLLLNLLRYHVRPAPEVSISVSVGLALGLCLTIVFAILMVVTKQMKPQIIAQWVKHCLVTSGFMTVIYLLFFELLKVQTPRGLIF